MDRKGTQRFPQTDERNQSEKCEAQINKSQIQTQKGLCLISTTHNSTYPKVAVQWLNQALCFYQSFCLVESEVLRNRHLRVAAKRVWLESIIQKRWLNAVWLMEEFEFNSDGLPTTPFRGSCQPALCCRVWKWAVVSDKDKRVREYLISGRPIWAERKWTVRWSLERARRWGKYMVTFACTTEYRRYRITGCVSSGVKAAARSVRRSGGTSEVSVVRSNSMEKGNRRPKVEATYWRQIRS